MSGAKKNAADYFASDGLKENKITAIPLRIAQLKQGHHVLDIGCGRGELVLQSARLGATAIGIDYSQSAIDIANKTKARLCENIRKNATFFCVNAEALEFDDDSFDRVFLMDVVEHVSPGELETILNEAARVLKPGGMLVIHTPNIWTRTWGYWIKSALLLPVRGRIPVHPVVRQFRLLKSDPDYDEHKILLHINEQSIVTLRRSLKRCGFTCRVWIENPGNRWEGRKDATGRALSLLYRMSHLKYFLGPEIAASATPIK